MSFITLIIVISILVFVHELGHFIAAKLSKVRVDEFAIGFPPKLFSFKWGETLYTVNLILLGGFVKIFGETPDADSIAGPDSGRSFVNKNRGLQAIILIAGIAMNIAFAWILLSGSLMLGVREATDNPELASSVLVAEVVQGSPAERAGLIANDVIQDTNSTKLQKAIADSKGAPITLSYLRGQTVATTSIAAVGGIVEGKSAIGIAMIDVADVRYGFFRALYEGAKNTWNLTVDTAFGILMFLKSIFMFKADIGAVSGPVGIATYLNQAREFGAATLIMFVAVISINLAVVNLLPFPALDGGRLLFVAIEAIIRRPISPKIANTLNAVGFGLLLLLMLVITVSDVTKLFR